MKLIYKDVDITNKVKILHANVNDTAGGEADSVELILSDTEKLWMEWGPEKGDEFAIIQNGFTSGVMYVYFLQSGSGVFAIKGRSIPPRAKTPNSRQWENVRFNDMAGDIADNYGFKLSAYGISDWLYPRVEQVNDPDFKFLSDRCSMESCCLKVHDKWIIIYSEPYMEAKDTVLTLTRDNIIGDPLLTTVSDGLYSSCNVKYLDPSNKLIDHTFTPKSAPAGPVMKINTRVANYGEAERFAKGWLRYANKNETFGELPIKLNTEVAAGNTIQLKNFGSFSGKYFVSGCTQKLLDDKTILKIRKVLEGY